MSSSLFPATVPPAEREALGARIRRICLVLIAGGGLIGLIGLFAAPKQTAYSYLLAYMFFLSLALGSMFLVMIHHLFDASWSVPIRRVAEHIAFLMPALAALFIPVALLAPSQIYEWMHLDPHLDHALHAKQPLFTLPAFYGVAILLFVLWTWLAFRLRFWSLQQDHATADQPVAGRLLFPEQVLVWASRRMGHATENNLLVFASRMMRVHSGYGIYLFAFTLTLAAVMWMKGLEHQWYSTMYGVYYFAGSVWTTLATLYVLAVVLDRAGPLSGVIHHRQLHDLGVLFFAFTVFYAYIAFSQYFLIWNAAIPEETFYFVQRERGSWWSIGLLLIFGHFLLPFLAMLRIDTKLLLSLMLPLCGWAWVMHYCDLSFNIMPVLHPDGFQPHILDLACFAFIGGILGWVFSRYFARYHPYPVRDPRLEEALGVHHAGPMPPAATSEERP